jgi:hypothetical protein
VPCRSDAHCGHPALRSLDAGSLSASLPSLASNAGSTARAHPSRTRIPRESHIEAPRREPVGRRAVGRSRSPSARKPFTTNSPNPRSPPPKLGVSPCRVARTLTAGILPSVRWMLARSRHPCLRSPATPAPRHGPTPHAPASRPRKTHRSPPARAGGTAGCWAVPAPVSPQAVHHQLAQSAFTINQSLPLGPPDGEPLGDPVPDHRRGQAETCSSPGDFATGCPSGR